jgi:tubulin polyglutamylase TTLL1
MCQAIDRILMDVAVASEDTINPNRRRNCFQLLGCDFMVTDNFEVVLIEINSNPCLEFSSPYLERLLTGLLEDTFQLTVDRFFPPPKRNCTKATAAAIEHLQQAKQHNRFRLLYQQQPPQQQESSG